MEKLVVLMRSLAASKFAMPGTTLLIFILEVGRGTFIDVLINFRHGKWWGESLKGTQKNQRSI